MGHRNTRLQRKSARSKTKRDSGIGSYLARRQNIVFLIVVNYSQDHDLCATAPFIPSIDSGPVEFCSSLLSTVAIVVLRKPVYRKLYFSYTLAPSDPKCVDILVVLQTLGTLYISPAPFLSYFYRDFLAQTVSNQLLEPVCCKTSTYSSNRWDM